MEFNNREDIIQMTPLWRGERLPDGRPLVPSSVIERIRKMSLEEVWEVGWNHYYNYQFQSGFKCTNNNGKPTVGRAVTSVFMPIREDLEIAMKRQGKKQGMRVGYNQWVCDHLIEDDVWVTDFYDKVQFGTIIGGNLGTVIAKKTKRGGAVVWGGVRDLDQLKTIQDINVFYRGIDPTPIRDHVMTGFNSPCRIGEAICLPGDIVYACESGVLFVPAHLAEEVADFGEKTHLKDIFGFQRVREGVYTGSQVDHFPWSAEMFADFEKWMETAPEAQAYSHLDWTEDRRICNQGHFDTVRRYLVGTQIKSIDEV